MSKVAIIEDDYTIAAMYKFKLDQSGYKTELAHDGAVGLELIKNFKPDLVLLDLKMPVMNGEDMLEQLRATEEGSKVTVVVLTNISRDEIPQKLRLLNVERYIVKAHSTPAQVVKVVEEVLRAQGLMK